jgi:hypothetical protein
MKPRIGVYLSKRTAARLMVAARRREISKSALVEAAIDRYLASENAPDALMMAGRLAELRGQVDQLDTSLGIVSEIVSLHARFHLAIAPAMPQAPQPAAGRLGPARHDGVAAQVERHVQPGTALLQETMDRLDATAEMREAEPGGKAPSAGATGFDAPTWAHEVQNAAAVREDGSNDNFPARPGRPVH